MSILSRYLDGQHAQSWTELLGCGPSIRDNAETWSDACAVADETMGRVRRNVERLQAGLPDIGYRFDHPGKVLVRPPAGIGAAIDRLEATIGGPVPLAFRAFWEQVGSVDLSGSHPGWPHELLDPLMFEADACPYLDTRLDMIEQAIIGRDDPIDLDFAPDDLHKANISGGAPYSVRAPDGAVDGLVLWEIHQTTFVNYLRIVLLGLGGMGGAGSARHHGHDPLPVPPELLRLAGELEPF